MQNVVNAQDWRVVTDSLKGYMTPELKKKLDGIANGANNYVHPSSHPASMIAQDATHRFVSDTEKNTWNGKASTSLVSTTANGLMPKRDGSATSIFTGDGVWKSLAWNLITGKPSTFAPSAHNHDGSYLKLSGGSLTGALNLANGIWNKIGDDVYIGDSNQAGCLCIKGVNADSGIAFVNKDNTVQIAKLTYAGGNLISSAKIQANLAGTADKATNADNATKATQDSNGDQINTTYLKRSGGTITGDITIDTSSERKFVGSGINAGIYFNSTGMGFYDWENSRHVFHYIQDQNLVEIQSTLTAPTPISSDNSNNVATTAFVKSLFTASKQQNGWWKDTNTGFLYQWGSLTASIESETYYMYGEATFPLTFSTVFQAVITHDGFAPTGSCVNGLSNSQIKVKLGVFGVTPQNTPWTCRYIAIGLA